MNNINEGQFVIYQAPAGSGKTHLLCELTSSLQNKKENILVITFTNAAVNELNSRINYENCTIMTIHSFVAKYLKNFWKNEILINHYFDIFGDSIIKSLNDTNKVERYKEYMEIDDINLEIIRANIELKYSERPNSSYLYGSLSHNDLIAFFNGLSNNKIMQMLIKNVYSHIFIDEYQDTPLDFIEFVYNCCQNGNTKLHLFGDELQQIYDITYTEFQDILNTEFIIDNRLVYNYRSSSSIVNTLNRIYSQFNPNLQQRSKYTNASTQLIKPKLILLSDEEIQNFDYRENSGIYLVPKNDTINLVAGIREIAKAIENIEEKGYKKYGYTSRKDAVDVLSDTSKNNPEVLVYLVYIYFELKDLSNNNAWDMVQGLLQNCNIFAEEILRKETISDLRNTRNKIEAITSSNYGSIDDIINKMVHILNKEILAEISECRENDSYGELLKIDFKIVENAYKFAKNEILNISTHHNVKGESHNYVSFCIFQNNKTVGIDYKEMVEFCIDSNIQLAIKEYAKTMFYWNKFLKNILFDKDRLFEEIISQFLLHCNPLIAECFFSTIPTSIKNKTQLNKFINEIRKYKRIVTSYKLFYVGCSRARENLIIYARDDDFTEASRIKMKEFGFNICNESN